ncbi:MAG: hypothetical protein ABSG17_21755 [Spirochaetia bacterium]
MKHGKKNTEDYHDEDNHVCSPKGEHKQSARALPPQHHQVAFDRHERETLRSGLRQTIESRNEIVNWKTEYRAIEAMLDLAVAQAEPAHWLKRYLETYARLTRDLREKIFYRQPFLARVMFSTGLQAQVLERMRLNGVTQDKTLATFLEGMFKG